MNTARPLPRLISPSPAATPVRREFLRNLAAATLVPTILASSAQAQSSGTTGTPTYVFTMADLKALSVSGVSAGTLCYVSGYYAEGDGGGGMFHYYPTPSSPPDNYGTTITPSSGPGAWYRAIENATVTPEMFGAVGDGTTDDYTRLDAAVQFIQAIRGSLRFAPKNYLISNTLQITASNCSLEGCGVYGTMVTSSSATADIIKVLGASVGSKVTNVAISGMFLTRTGAPTAGCGINLHYAHATRLRNLQSDGSVVGIRLYQATNTLLDDIVCSITTGSTDFTGFWLNGGNTQSSVSSVFTNCIAVKAPGHTANSFGFKCDGTQIQDLKFVNPETAGTAFGFYFDGSALASPYYLQDIEILNPVMDQITATGILIVDSGVEAHITITDGWSNPKAGASTYGIYLLNSAGVVIKGFQFFADVAYSLSRGLGIDNCERIVATANMFISQQYGVYFSGTNRSCSVSNNSFVASTLTKKAATFLAADGCDRCVFQGNVFNGYATTGIAINSGSKNIVTCNSVDPTNINNPIVDLGMSTVLANNVVT